MSHPLGLPPVAGEASSAAEVAARGIAGNAPALLVMDDDLEVGSLIAGIAGELGFASRVASDFDEFRRSVRGLRGVVVLDLHLPELDGVEIIRFLAKERCSADLVLVSGVGERLIRAAEKLAIERGLAVLGCLSKPFHPRELRALLRASQRQPSARAHAAQAPGLSEAEILEAVRRRQLEVHYQPKRRLSTGEISGVEALVRLRHASGALLPPDSFISLSEKMGLIDGLTSHVCGRAMADCGRWQAAGMKAGVSVNLSVRSLHGLDFPDLIAARAESYGVAPEKLTLEVTESSLAQEPVRALDILTRLRLKGFGLSIDDFGMGYSTMQQLERIPFGELKLDRGFVRGAATSPGARAIMSSSIELAHNLEMQVVAEGVETQADWDLAAALGCDEVQGFLIARPMPIDELMEWMQAQ